MTKIVTSVAFISPDEAEPVSPELALVDPLPAERLRASMVEAEPTSSSPFRAPGLEPDRVVGDNSCGSGARSFRETNVRVLRLAPAAE